MKKFHGAAFFVVGVIVLWTGLTRVTYEVDVIALLPPDLPEVKGVSTLSRHFSRHDELMVTLESGDAAVTEMAAESLAAALSDHPEQVSGVVWGLPLQTDPLFAAEFLAYLWFNAAPTEVEGLEISLGEGESSARIDSVIEDLESGLLDEDMILRTYDPLGFTAIPGGLESTTLVAEEGGSDPFSSADGTYRLLYVSAARDDLSDYTEVIEWIDAVRPLVATWKQDFLSQHPEAGDSGLRVGYTGHPAFVAEVSAGMRADMSGSMIFTSLFVFALFWLIHRQIKPLLWLIAMLVMITGVTLLIGGSVFGQLSVMSIGFAAILVGLAVDYGVVLFKEAHVAPGDPAKLRRVIGPSVAWAAATTGVVFFALYFSSLPGVAQLGILVTSGVVVGAVVMLIFFAPVAARYGPRHDSTVTATNHATSKARDTAGDRMALVGTLVLLAAAAATLGIKGSPEMVTDFKPMRLRDSPSMDAFDRTKEKIIGMDDRSVTLLVSAADPEQLSAHLIKVDTRLSEALSAGEIEDYQLPTLVAPNLPRQNRNRDTLARLLSERERLLGELDEAGFSEDAAKLANGVFSYWRKFLDTAQGTALTPVHPIGQWVVQRFASVDEDSGEWAAMGKVGIPATILGDLTAQRDWSAALTRETDGSQIANWPTLSLAVHEKIRGDFVHVFLPMALFLAAMLWVVFRNISDVALALATLAFGGLLVVTLTQWLGFSWNFFNITAVPILFGTGLDYSIHMIFALRRHQGDLLGVRRGISKAILFCAGSTAVGFGSLSIAANNGLSSLGQICSIGILANMICALLLLPHWWRLLHRRQIEGTAPADADQAISG